LTVPALMLHPSDNVATAVRPLEEGEYITVFVAGRETTVMLVQSVPSGHKFALQDTPAGEKVTKYGETIGRATVFIRAGEHVHIHNLEGLRGRGDRR
jgi:altronate dehydratase small subunit